MPQKRNSISRWFQVKTLFHLDKLMTSALGTKPQSSKPDNTSNNTTIKASVRAEEED